jgi:hypothetical protein
MLSFFRLKRWDQTESLPAAAKKIYILAKNIIFGILERAPHQQEKPIGQRGATVTRSLRTRDPIAAIASSSAELVTTQY